MAYKPNAANSTPAALKAAKLHAVVYGVALAIGNKQVPTPFSVTEEFSTNPEVSFASDSYQNLSPADKAHNKAVEAFLASHAKAGA